MTEEVQDFTEEQHEVSQQEILEVDEITAESTVPEIIQWIRDGIDEERTGSDIIRIVMDLPPVRRIPGEKNLAALKTILREYSIKLPQEIEDTIVRGRSAEFSFSAPAREKYLRPRNVIVNTAPEVCTLMITGEEPVDGIKGYTEIHYDFSVKSGRLYSDGTIDFREINMFPQAKEGELLLRIFEPTEGVAGTDVYGWRIAPVPGEPVRIEFGDNITTENDYDEDERRDYIDVFAARPGIIVTDFGGKGPKAENIVGISIQNRLELNDIDFTTGNVSGAGGELRCTADVSVKGDIRGSFSVLIEGMLEVKGTVEGETIDASGEVIAHLVRSSIRSGRFIDTVAATHAKLTASEYVRISREFTYCTIKAPEVILEEEHGREVLCGRADIFTERLRATNVEIRNRVEISLGEKLIAQLHTLDNARHQLEAVIAAEDSHLKTRAHALGKKLQLTYTLLPDNLKKVVVGIKKLGAAILSEKICSEEAADKVARLAGSLGPEFSSLLDQLKRIVKIQEVREEKIAKWNDIVKQRGVILDELRNMRVIIDGVLTPKGQVIIRCAECEQRYLGESSSNTSIDIVIGYDPVDNALCEIHEGDEDDEYEDEYESEMTDAGVGPVP